MSCRFVSAAVLAVIIGSLCFSVGEGLRLTPFSVSELTEKTETTHYGPLDVPVQPQKRSKRQALDLACPDAEVTRNVVAPLTHLFEYEPAGTASLLFVHRPEGRAPPSFS